MVCCCVPCIRKCQGRVSGTESKLDAVDIGLATLVATELVRWITIITPLYLCVWQYTEYRGFYTFVTDADEAVQFWSIVTAIILGASLVVYLPLKVAALRFRLSKNDIRDHRWRPSIVVYIFLCALPCLWLILVATKSPAEPNATGGGSTTEAPDPCYLGPSLDAEPAAVLQIAVFGLTVTEWMSKLREEVMTYDLITAMAIDFFFAYDVIAFIMMTREPDVFNSAWVYVCFVFAWIAMFKYVPTQPVSIYENGAPKGAVTGIVVTLVCCDIPFVVVRLSTLFTFGFEASDFIHPVKNIGMICFGATQLWFIYQNTQDAKQQREVRYSEKRISKYPGLWEDTPDGVRVTPATDHEKANDLLSVHSNASYVPDRSVDGTGTGQGQPPDLQISDLE